MNSHLVDLLRSALTMSQRKLLQLVAEEASSDGWPTYIVGGLPRDLLLGYPIGDLDVVIEGDAITLSRRMARRYGGIVQTHPKFRTAKWVLPRKPAAEADFPWGQSPSNHLDLISARSESYPKPGELPHILRGTIDEDLQRRDFTINTLAIRLDGSHFGEVRDDFGAETELCRGVVRVLHEGSFRDDPTRMYRAVRYEQRYGFQIAPETEALIPGARELITKLSAHRIRHELELILEEPGAEKIIQRLDDLDLLKPIHRWLPRNIEAMRRLSTASDPLDIPLHAASKGNLPWVLWLMGCSAEELRSIHERLHFRRELLMAIKSASELLNEIGSLTPKRPSEITMYLKHVSPLAIQSVYRSLPEGKRRTVLRLYLTRWRHIKPTATGHDLKALGATPGPVYKTILQELGDAWLDGKITNKAQERKRLETLIRRMTKTIASKTRGQSYHSRRN